MIFWASTIPGRFPQTAGSSEEKYNHRMYRTTTKDFVTFTPTALFYDPGFSVIDATFLDTAEGPPADRQGRDALPAEEIPADRAGVATSTGRSARCRRRSRRPGVWVEGPTALKIGDDYLVYFDAYVEKHYGAMRSRDLVDVGGRQPRR